MSLERLLKHYIMSEKVHNVECDGCAGHDKTPLTSPEHEAAEPKPRTTCLKKLTIGKVRPLCTVLCGPITCVVKFYTFIRDNTSGFRGGVLDFSIS